MIKQHKSRGWTFFKINSVLVVFLRIFRRAITKNTFDCASCNFTGKRIYLQAMEMNFNQLLRLLYCLYWNKFLLLKYFWKIPSTETFNIFWNSNGSLYFLLKTRIAAIRKKATIAVKFQFLSEKNFECWCWPLSKFGYAFEYILTGN